MEKIVNVDKAKAQLDFALSTFEGARKAVNEAGAFLRMLADTKKLVPAGVRQPVVDAEADAVAEFVGACSAFVIATARYRKAFEDWKTLSKAAASLVPPFAQRTGT